MLRRRPALFLLAVLASSACATDPTTPSEQGTPREASGPLMGRAIEFALEPGALDPAGIDAVAKYLETATGAESISISVRESADDGTMVVVESWGRAAITDDALTAGLRQTFPSLSNAMIAVKAMAGDAPGQGLAELDVDHDDDPEVVRQQVIEQLRAQGVQGDVQVHVDDDDEGRREVRVEVEDRRHE